MAIVMMMSGWLFYPMNITSLFLRLRLKGCVATRKVQAASGNLPHQHTMCLVAADPHLLDEAAAASDDASFA